jgi:hypothetical protein
MLSDLSAKEEKAADFRYMMGYSCDDIALQYRASLAF